MTLRDIARLTGVSSMTVSRVLNDSPLVAPETAARVRAAIADARFRPNRSARNLSQGRTVTMVGLVVDDIGNPFYASFSRAVESVTHEHRSLLVVSSCGEDPGREREVVTTLLDHGLDGLLLFPTAGDHGYLAASTLDHVPIVSLGRSLSGLTTDHIRVDNVAGARKAVAHLHAHGHTRIGAIGYGHGEDATDDPGADHLAGRIEGYRRAMSDAGLEYRPELLRLGCAGAGEAAAAVDELMNLPEPPTALFAMNNRMTVGALRALGTGLQGVALIGFDDFELAEVFDPPISVVTQDPAAMGRRAARLLFSRLAGGQAPAKRITLPMTLIERGSGELPPRGCRRSRRAVRGA